MDTILLIGINHQTAPVELRECIAFSETETAEALEIIGRHPQVNECMIFSTCNRVELLLITPDPEAGQSAAQQFLAEYNRVPLERFADALYRYEGDEAVRHVFRVAASLDSMVVGEPQILGQVKEAYRAATRKKTTGVVLNRLLHRAFFVAKRVRTETGIGDSAVSISYAAIELGRKIFDTLDGRHVLLIGAGEMAELAVEHLRRNRVGKIFVANRTFARGVELARRFSGQAVRFEELASILQEVDIIISSTGASGYVVTRDEVKDIIRSRRNRPLFFIDIAVPRDIDPRINRLANTYVYDIDDLQGVIEENVADRKREALKGERIVDEAVLGFGKWRQSLDVVPTIVALRRKLDAIAAQEMHKTLANLEGLSSGNRKALERMTRAIVNKTLHDPTVLLKSDSFHGDRSAYLDAVRRLFNLDKQDD